LIVTRKIRGAEGAWGIGERPKGAPGLRTAALKAEGKERCATCPVESPLAQTVCLKELLLRQITPSLSGCSAQAERTRAGRRGFRLTAEIPQGEGWGKGEGRESKAV